MWQLSASHLDYRMVRARQVHSGPQLVSGHQLWINELLIIRLFRQREEDSLCALNLLGSQSNVDLKPRVFEVVRLPSKVVLWMAESAWLGAEGKLNK